MFNKAHVTQAAAVGSIGHLDSRPQSSSIAIPIPHGSTNQSVCIAVRYNVLDWIKLMQQQYARSCLLASPEGNAGWVCRSGT